MTRWFDSHDDDCLFDHGNCTCRPRGGHTIAPPIRTFDTGATRDTDEGKLDYEGFLSPLVLKRFAEYMHKNRVQKDGSLRDSDNWQKGIPIDAYMKSLFRHFMEVWTAHRGHGDIESWRFEDALCAMLFNVQGMLHEVLKSYDEPIPYTPND